MDYIPPVGGAADAPYIDGNPNTGTEGSIPPAAAIEYPMREIVNAIIALGGVQDGEDLTQLGAAISALSNNTLAKSHTPNGYQELPGGLIIQWAVGAWEPADNTEPTQTINWPIVFPTAALWASVALELSSTTDRCDHWYQYAALNKNTITTQRQCTGTGAAETTTRPCVFALGI